jgi:peptidoglycan/xylan/chitin deacetylase (PgdA/CDA1 family)
MRLIASLRSRLVGYEIVYRRDHAGDRVCLTFDDGPAPWTTPILDTLNRHDAHATFFVLGVHVSEHPDVASRIVSDGHELGSHGMKHVDLTTVGTDELRAGLDHAQRVVEDVTGVRPVVFRPPYATSDRRVAHVAASVGLKTTVLRDVDPADWRATDADAVVEAVLTGTRSGSIVCLHDGVPAGNRGIPSRDVTAEAVARLVPELQARGFDLVTVSELLS